MKSSWLGTRGEVRDVMLLGLAIIARLTEKRSLIEAKSSWFGPMARKRAYVWQEDVVWLRLQA
ncbi:hypothetical protein HanIR_Chr13g0666591 [Helianthus annuus]|nr:hypothetical protein HanIR_Chr13g0666591 [Helianthus annuus]